MPCETQFVEFHKAGFAKPVLVGVTDLRGVGIRARLGRFWSTESSS